jgi:hypothetical protein
MKNATTVNHVMRGRSYWEHEDNEDFNVEFQRTPADVDQPGKWAVRHANVIASYRIPRDLDQLTDLRERIEQLEAFVLNHEVTQYTEIESLWMSAYMREQAKRQVKEEQRQRKLEANPAIGNANAKYMLGKCTDYMKANNSEQIELVITMQNRADDNVHKIKARMIRGSISSPRRLKFMRGDRYVYWHSNDARVPRAEVLERLAESRLNAAKLEVIDLIRKNEDGSPVILLTYEV